MHQRLQAIAERAVSVGRNDYFHPDGFIEIPDQDYQWLRRQAEILAKVQEYCEDSTEETISNDRVDIILRKVIAIIREESA